MVTVPDFFVCYSDHYLNKGLVGYSGSPNLSERLNNHSFNLVSYQAQGRHKVGTKCISSLFYATKKRNGMIIDTCSQDPQNNNVMDCSVQ